jgi:hypothetical protein
MARVHVNHTGMYMYNANMCIKILCRLYFEHIKIYQSYLKGTYVYFEYIQIVFQIYIPNILRQYYTCIQGLL